MSESKYNAIILSKQRLDYVKADKSEVHATILDFLAVPQNEYEARNRDGFIVHNIYVRDNDRVDVSDFSVGDCGNIDYYIDRWGHPQLLSFSRCDTVDLSILFSGGNSDAEKT